MMKWLVFLYWIPTDMEFDEPEMESPTVEMSVDMEMSDMEMPEPSFTEMIRRNIYKCNRHTDRNV